MNHIKHLCPASFKATLKFLTRNTIYKANSWIIKIKQLFSSKKIFKLKNSHCFFGYYDISPFNNDDSLILSLCTDAPLKTPEKNSKAQVGYFVIKKNKLNSVGETDTWCWQQGCRLQWYPRNCKTEKIFYNSSYHNEYKGLVQDIYTKEIVRTTPIPLYDISRDGSKGLSLDFFKLQKYRPGYGYVFSPGKKMHIDYCKNEGVWLYDFKTDSLDLIVPLENIVQLEQKESMYKAVHYLNHISINPSATKFMVLHLWLSEGKRFSRVVISNIDGTGMHVLNNSGHDSHYTWKNDAELLTYCKFNDKFSYVLYDIKNKWSKIIGEFKLTDDGHPSFTKSKKYLISDTYPDKNRLQNIFSFNLENENIEIISTHFRPLCFEGEVRCDLHPRLSGDNKLICVDDVHGSKRVISLIENKYF